MFSIAAKVVMIQW